MTTLPAVLLDEATQTGECRYENEGEQLIELSTQQCIEKESDRTALEESYALCGPNRSQLHLVRGGKTTMLKIQEANCFDKYADETTTEFTKWLRDNGYTPRESANLAELANERRWVAWREEINEKGKLTKIPKDPAGGGNAKVPTDPRTYGTRAAAEKRWQIIKTNIKNAVGGFGIVLGDLANGYYLVGIDLDSCRDANGTIASWAQEVIARFATYSEVSPSATGVKLFFLMSADDWSKLLDLLGTNKTGGEQLTRKTFAAGRHREVAIDTARFYSVTEQRLEDCPNSFRLVPFTDVQWFIEVAGPNYKALQRGNGQDKNPFTAHGEEVSPELDETGSGFGWRFMTDCIAKGMSYEEAKAAILADENEAGEWANRSDERQLKRAYERQPNIEALEPKKVEKIDQWAKIEPVDLWATGKGPALPKGLLPKIIEDLAFEHGTLMGVDPAGLAMAALAICGAVIPDGITLQVKRNDRWLESVRLWVALVGLPSTKKTPLMKKLMRVVMRISTQMMHDYLDAKAAYDRLPNDEKKNTERPKKTLLWLDDTTYEAAAEVMQDSEDGVLVFNDELNGWFGAMDKYGGHRGAAADRSFWLKSFDGGPRPWNRVGRGQGIIPNLSASILGGIQPDTMRKVVAEGIDDGLIQRLNPIMLRSACVGHDDPISPSLEHYEDLVMALWEKRLNISELKFTDKAQVIRQKLEREHDELTQDYEHFNRKLASHIGKYDGMFARYCLLWHLIEHHDDKWPTDVDDDVAQQVAAFMHEFLLPHAIAFYTDMVGFSDEHERVLAVAGYILAQKLEKVTNRDVHRGVRSMRGLERREIESLFDKLHAVGWINYAPARRFTDPPVGIVNPKVHGMYEDIAEQERTRRERVRKLIAREAEKRRKKD